MKEVDPAHLADSYIRAIRLEEALSLVRKLRYDNSPRSKERAFFLEAQIYRKRGYFPEVSSLVDSLLKLNPKHGGGYLLRAKNCYAQLEQHYMTTNKLSKNSLDSLKSEGIEALDNILKDNLTDPEAEEDLKRKEVKGNLRGAAFLLWAAFEARLGGDQKLIEKSITNGLNVESSADHYNNIANIYLLIKNYKKAEIYIERAVQMDPNESAFWDTFAELRAKQNDECRMYECLDKAFQGSTSTRLNVEDYLNDERFKSFRNKDGFKQLMQKYLN